MSPPVQTRWITPADRARNYPKLIDTIKRPNNRTAKWEGLVRAGKIERYSDLVTAIVQHPMARVIRYKYLFQIMYEAETRAHKINFPLDSRFKLAHACRLRAFTRMKEFLDFLIADQLTSEE